jgi:hypothetical protein
MPIARARRQVLALLALPAAGAFAGCALQTQALRAQPPADLPSTRELAGTPFFAQTAYQCGPAALATALGSAGIDASPETLGEQVFLPARTGTLQIEMLAGARRHGAVATRIAPTLEALLREIDAGHPVVVLQNLGLSWWPVWHYAVAIGYDLPAGDLLLRSGTTRREVMALSTFEHTWRRSGAWGFVALPPGQWPASASEKDIVEAAIGFERVAPAPVAVAVYRSALQRWPGNLTLAIGQGNSLHASGDRAAAVAAFRAAAEVHRSAAAWVNLSATLVELGRIEEALQAADAALATGDPQWRDAADQARVQALAALEETKGRSRVP